LRRKNDMITENDFDQAAGVLCQYVLDHGSENGVVKEVEHQGIRFDVEVNYVERFSLAMVLLNLQKEIQDAREAVGLVTLGHAANVLIDECIDMEAPNFRAHTVQRGDEVWEIIVRRPCGQTVDEILRELRKQVRMLRESHG
jgi:hypothetical protein